MEASEHTFVSSLTMFFVILASVFWLPVFFALLDNRDIRMLHTRQFILKVVSAHAGTGSMVNFQWDSYSISRRGASGASRYGSSYHRLLDYRGTHGELRHGHRSGYKPKS